MGKVCVIHCYSSQKDEDEYDEMGDRCFQARP
jgi:hypothetical protein